MESPIADFDDVLSHLGVGKWNLISLLGLGYWYFLMPGQLLAGSFLAPDVEHKCHPPEIVQQFNNYTDVISISKCHYNISLSTGINETTHNCEQWEYDNATFGSTITSEFNLVCSSAYLRMSYSSIFMFGALVGAPCNGISDRYGRKRILSFGTIVFSVLCILSTWVPNVESLLVVRFLLGFVYPCSTLSGYNLVLEAFGKEWRSVVGVAIWLPWVLGTILWGGIAYLIRDWRTLHMVVSLPTILFLPFLWYMDESPRWLVVAGHEGKAKKVLERAARLNHVQPLTHDQMTDVMEIVRCQQNISPEKKYEDSTSLQSSLLSYCQKLSSSALVLFRTPRLRTLTLVNWQNSFIASMTFFGLSLSGVSYSDDPYLYMVLSGLAELPSVTMVVPIIRRWGRRPPSVAFFFASGVSLLLLPFVSQGWHRITLAMIGKLTISMAFNIMILHITELYPTEVRLQGAGAGLMMSRLGSTFSPFITDWLGPLVKWAPSVVFGVGSLMSGAAVLLLPESKGRSLPDTIHDFENYNHKDHRSSLETKDDGHHT